MENIFHPALARFSALGPIPDDTDILSPEHHFIYWNALSETLIWGTWIKKRCLVFTGRNLNDFRAPCGRLSLGVCDFLRVSRLGDHGWFPNMAPWTHSYFGRNITGVRDWFGAPGSTSSRSCDFRQRSQAHLEHFLSWKCSRRCWPQGSSWRFNGADIGKHRANCNAFCQRGVFRSVDCLCLFLASALAPLLASSPLVCFHDYPEVSLSRPLPSVYLQGDLSLLEVHWLRDWAKVAAETGDGWKAGLSICFLLPLLKVGKKKKKKRAGVRNVCCDLDRAEVGQGKGAGAGF